MMGSTQRPSYTTRSRDAKEILDFTLVEAHKELATNQIDQFRKQLECREYSNWIIQDLQSQPERVKIREKQRLLSTYPSICAGIVAHKLSDTTWLPALIVESKERRNSSKYYGLMVYWVSVNGLGGLTYLNNGLENDTDFETFAIEGLSDNYENDFAVGEKGRGFVLSMHYLLRAWEELKTGRGTRNHIEAGGVEFRVRNKVGECAFAGKCPKELFKMYETTVGGPKSLKLKPEYMRSAKADEVCITALSCFLTTVYPPLKLFSGFYGVFKPDVEFKTGDVILYVDKKATGGGQFFLRSQVVEHGMSVGMVGVNYLGDFYVTSDRTSLKASKKQQRQYRKDVGRAILKAVNESHPIVPFIIKDMMNTEVHGKHDFCFCLQDSDVSQNGLSPEEQNRWRKAFQVSQANSLKQENQVPKRTSLPLFLPHLEKEFYVTNREEDKDDIIAFGMVPVVACGTFVQVMEKYGIYPPIKTYMQNALIASATTTFKLPYVFDDALQHMFPNIPSRVLHALPQKEPRVAWAHNTLHINTTSFRTLNLEEQRGWMASVLVEAFQTQPGGGNVRTVSMNWILAFTRLDPNSNSTATHSALENPKNALADTRNISSNEYEDDLGDRDAWEQRMVSEDSEDIKMEPSIHAVNNLGSQTWYIQHDPNQYFNQDTGTHPTNHGQNEPEMEFSEDLDRDEEMAEDSPYAPIISNLRAKLAECKEINQKQAAEYERRISELEERIKVQDFDNNKLVQSLQEMAEMLNSVRSLGNSVENFQAHTQSILKAHGRQGDDASSVATEIASRTQFPRSESGTSSALSWKIPTGNIWNRNLDDDGSSVALSWRGSTSNIWNSGFGFEKCGHNKRKFDSSSVASHMTGTTQSSAKKRPSTN